MSDHKIVIFGTGDVAQIANYYFARDAIGEVVAFTVDGDYRTTDTFEGLPVVAFEEIEQRYPPGAHEMFIALSYSQMNRLREARFHAAHAKGYSLTTYVSPDTTYRSQYPPGENCFIFEDNTVQPFVHIGDDVILWSGNHIGHHSTIEAHNFVSSHVVVSGHCHIEPNCFLGVNSTVGHQVRIAQGTLLAAGATVTRDTEANGVYMPAKTVKRDITSDRITL